MLSYDDRILVIILKKCSLMLSDILSYDINDDDDCINMERS